MPPKSVAIQSQLDSYSLVIPMAGEGSRFSDAGFDKPKPLIDLDGRPFFWWAVNSVVKNNTPEEMVFVVLRDHCRKYGIDDEVLKYFPSAEIVVREQVSAGAAETAKSGIQALRFSGPVAINDCDHAFSLNNFKQTLNDLHIDAQGALLCFDSDNPAYSYALVSDTNEVLKTVEKKVVSRSAIAGCYMFSSPSTFKTYYDLYLKQCPYNELFMSGIFNIMVANNKKVIKSDIDPHISFGTPEEYLHVRSEHLLSTLSFYSDE